MAPAVKSVWLSFCRQFYSLFLAFLIMIGCVKEQRTKRGGVVYLDTELLYMFSASGSQAGRHTAFQLFRPLSH